MLGIRLDFTAPRIDKTLFCFYNKTMFVFLMAILLLLFPTFASAQVVNKTQLIKSTHWVYDAMAALETETKRPLFIETAPLTVGEIEFYFKQIERETLSESGKAIYDEVDNFLHSKPIGFFPKEFGLAINPYVNLEFYYKSNPETDWSFNYFYEDNLFTLPINVGISEYFSGGAEIFLGVNYDAAQRSWNFANFPLKYTDLEFSQPTWAYGSTGVTFENWGMNLVVAREGLRIGRTLLGSIIYNDTFETQAFVQFNVYSPYFKYNLDVVQVNTNKYVYLHQFEMRLFKRLKLIALEGTLINGPFEFKNLNPFMIMHSFGLWSEDWSKDRKSAQYMAFLLEFSPIKNLKLYGLMAQNEITTFLESSKATPDSLGFQLGIDTYFPSKHRGIWLGTIEGIWTMPYLYIKPSEANTFYSNRENMHGPSDTIKSWMGSPYGPDCMGFALEFGYRMQRKWEAKIGYSLIAHGKNGFSMLDEKDFYPSDRYDNATTEEERQAASDDAKYLLPSGTVEFTHRVKINGSYYLNKYAQFNAQFMFVHVQNCGNLSGNSQTGVEMALSIKCEPL